MAAKASRWVTWMTPESTNNVSDLGALRPTSAAHASKKAFAPLNEKGPNSMRTRLGLQRLTRPAPKSGKTKSGKTTMQK